MSTDFTEGGGAARAWPNVDASGVASSTIGSVATDYGLRPRTVRTSARGCGSRRRWRRGMVGRDERPADQGPFEKDRCQWVSPA